MYKNDTKSLSLLIKQIHISNRKECPTLGIKQYSQEELKEMALVEIAHELFEEHKKPVPFQELLNEIASLLGVKKKSLETASLNFIQI